MEAASAVRLPMQMRMRRFERECERLRPLGEAYVMRRFGGSLSRADAEDAVSEVVIRLHRRMMDGRAPQNLRAAFFTSVRNAAIDQLRSRSARPTVALEAAADAPTDRAIPVESAEEREDGVRLQEALARMRTNYREAIVLRFGLGMTVPEISRHLNISLPAAKKLVLRASRQVRKRLESIEDAEFCPQMRELAQQSLFEKHASGLESETEAEILRTHFAHCGSCRSFVANLHDNLHELGSTALLGLTAVEGAGRSGLTDHLGAWAEAAANVAHAGVDKVRHAAFKLGAVLQSGEGTAGGALMGTGQKVAAVCTAGAAAATATCVATGIVGPGVATPLTSGPSHRDSPPAKVKHVSTPATTAPVTQPPATTSTQPSTASSAHTQTAKSSSARAHRKSKSTSKQHQAKSSSQQPAAQQGEFGFEGSPAPAPAPSPSSTSTSSSSVSLSSSSARSPSTSSSPSTGGGGSGGGSSGGGGGGGSGGGGGGSGGGGGGETFGFGG